MISPATVQRIKDEARVEDVVGEFVTLKKRGANLLGLCPFHNEKTPSFNVNPARNIYKCFGCGKVGDPVTFLMDYQQMTFPDALKYIAKKYGIEVEEEYSEQEQREHQEKQNLTESIFIANAYAQKFFSQHMLHSENGRIGLAYFKERGFLQSTIEKFQLGFAPDAPDALTKQALKDGFQLDILKKAGLTSPKENSTYDFFRNRVMFPIHNTTGKVVGFGGRIMVKDEKAPKYVNTPESEVYQKSKLLYGAFFARNAIRQQDECLLVEGYTDVISLHQAGIENVVASSGTALTPDQIRLIKRTTPNITMLYDGDAAGIKAALRGTDLILEEGMNVRIVLLPDAEDPDSYVRKSGADAFTAFVRNNRKDLILFKTSLFAAEAKTDPIKKAELIRDIMVSIGKIPDPIQRSVYVKECAQLFDIAEQILITEVNKLRRKKLGDEQKDAPATPIETGPTAAEVHRQQLNEASPTLPLLERELVRILMEFGNKTFPLPEREITVAEYVFEELEDISLQTPDYQLVYELALREWQTGHAPAEKFYIDNENDAVRRIAIEVLQQPYSLSDNWWNKYKIAIPGKEHVFVKDVQSALMRYKQYVNIAELKKIEQLLQEVKDETEMKKLMKLHKLLIEQKREFARTVGNVIYRPNM